MPQMLIALEALTLECKASREIVEFSPNITFFHGELGAGKSSIGRLIDFCLGADAEKTPAIQSELVSVSLTARLGIYHVLFERPAKNDSHIEISWQDSSGQGAHVSAPVTDRHETIWRDAEDRPLCTVSDMIFYLLGVTPPKVRKNKYDPDASLVRLSFRDVMWYCYLRQEEMEVTFLHLDNRGGFKTPKSRDVSRYVLGYHSEKLSELEVELDALVDDQRGKFNAARQMREFLSENGFGTTDEVRRQKQEAEATLERGHQSQEQIRSDYNQETHTVDRLRSELRAMSIQLADEEEALSDLRDRIEEQEALKAELLVTKFKLARTGTAAKVLGEVNFEHCPSCGTSLSERHTEDGLECYLCLQIPQERSEGDVVSRLDAVNQDLDNRINELQDAVARHQAAQNRQHRIVERIRNDKLALDARLDQEVRDYDSAYLARFREAERQIAMLEERLVSLDRILRLPEAVARLEQEAQQLSARIEQLRVSIEAEREALNSADKYREDLEEAYLDALLAVQFPGVSTSDEVHIDKKTWKPLIYPGGDPDSAWNYENAGSGGKKTLLKVCYTLAFHKVAADNDLPLPTLLIVDSPMKNISTHVNETNYRAFYRYLLRLTTGSLRDTQFVLIDSEYPELASPDLVITDRKMTLSDPDYPPLISYYHGQ